MRGSCCIRCPKDGGDHVYKSTRLGCPFFLSLRTQSAQFAQVAANTDVAKFNWRPQFFSNLSSLRVTWLRELICDFKHQLLASLAQCVKLRDLEKIPGENRTANSFDRVPCAPVRFLGLRTVAEALPGSGPF